MNSKIQFAALTLGLMVCAEVRAQSPAPLPSAQECVQKFTDKTWCATRTDLRGFLELDYPEYGGGPKAHYRAEAFSEVKVLWSSTGEALLLANAMPKTKATPTVLASLIIIHREGGGWAIGHSMSFLAAGTYSAAKAEAAEEGASAVITLTLTQGGRGNAYSQSETFKVEDHKLQRLPLPSP
ncbi:MAG: hypothetical protein WCH40_09530 [Verrucomicrobiales bacterium]